MSSRLKQKIVSYDNTLKYLVEQFPYDFAKWLVNAREDEELTILKTELSIEPITADSVIFMKVANRILHLECQTLPYSDKPIPFRMLDYWVRLKRKYNCEVIQVVIFLKETSSEQVFIEEFRDGNTVHPYRVIRIWEMKPEFFLDNLGLLPLAALAKTSQPRELLAQVAGKVDTIESRVMQSNVSACIQLLAGIRFNENLIKAYFREDIMKESVIYQSIKQEGKREGILEGKKETLEETKAQEVSLFITMLINRLGTLSPESEERIKQLSIPKLRELALALLNWNSEEELIQWLDNQA